jgi:enamine deaminase RidA (YjgF/YER057c/UK114 family)
MKAYPDRAPPRGWKVLFGTTITFTFISACSYAIAAFTSCNIFDFFLANYIIHFLLNVLVYLQTAGFTAEKFYPVWEASLTGSPQPSGKLVDGTGVVKLTVDENYESYPNIVILSTFQKGAWFINAQSMAANWTRLSAGMKVNILMADSADCFIRDDRLFLKKAMRHDLSTENAVATNNKAPIPVHYLYGLVHLPFGKDEIDSLGASGLPVEAERVINDMENAKGFQIYLAEKAGIPSKMVIADSIYSAGPDDYTHDELVELLREKIKTAEEKAGRPIRKIYIQPHNLTRRFGSAGYDISTEAGLASAAKMLYEAMAESDFQRLKCKFIVEEYIGSVALTGKYKGYTNDFRAMVTRMPNGELVVEPILVYLYREGEGEIPVSGIAGHCLRNVKGIVRDDVTSMPLDKFLKKTWLTLRQRKAVAVRISTIALKIAEAIRDSGPGRTGERRFDTMAVDGMITDEKDRGGMPICRFTEFAAHVGGEGDWDKTAGRAHKGLFRRNLLLSAVEQARRYREKTVVIEPAPSTAYSPGTEIKFNGAFEAQLDADDKKDIEMIASAGYAELKKICSTLRGRIFAPGIFGSEGRTVYLRLRKPVTVNGAYGATRTIRFLRCKGVMPRMTDGKVGPYDGTLGRVRREFTIDETGDLKVICRDDMYAPAGTMYYDEALNEYRTMYALYGKTAEFEVDAPVAVGRYTKLSHRGAHTGFVVAGMAEADVRLWRDFDSLAAFPVMGDTAKEILDQHGLFKRLGKVLREYHDRGFYHRFPLWRNFGIAKNPAGGYSIIIRDYETTLKRGPSEDPKRLAALRFLDIERVMCDMMDVVKRMKTGDAFEDHELDIEFTGIPTERGDLVPMMNPFLKGYFGDSVPEDEIAAVYRECLRTPEGPEAQLRADINSWFAIRIGRIIGNFGDRQRIDRERLWFETGQHPVFGTLLNALVKIEATPAPERPDTKPASLLGPDSVVIAPGLEEVGRMYAFSAGAGWLFGFNALYPFAHFLKKEYRNHVRARYRLYTESYRKSHNNHQPPQWLKALFACRAVLSAIWAPLLVTALTIPAALLIAPTMDYSGQFAFFAINWSMHILINFAVRRHNLKLRDKGIRCATVDMGSHKEVIISAYSTDANLSVTEQTIRLLRKVDRMLEETGCDRDCVVKQAVLLRQPDLWKCAGVMGGYYGMSPPATSFIYQPPLSGGTVAIEVLAVPKTAGVSINRVNNNLTILEYDGLKWAYVAGVEPDRTIKGTYEQAADGLNKMKEILEGHGFSYEEVVRTWLYQRDIVGFDKGKKTNRYKDLNQARKDLYKPESTPEPKLEDKDRWIKFKSGLYPASTGIGMSDGTFVMECLALSTDRADVTRRAVENPEQTSAFAYSGNKEKAPPLFSRSMEITIGDRRVFLISGTASIKGEDTRHKWSVRKQTETTIRNIEILLKEIGATKKDVPQVRVYIKHKKDYGKVKRIVERKFKDVPVIYALADICRPDLLVEIEAIAFARAAKPEAPKEAVPTGPIVSHFPLRQQPVHKVLPASLTGHYDRYPRAAGERRGHPFRVLSWYSLLGLGGGLDWIVSIPVIIYTAYKYFAPPGYFGDFAGLVAGMTAGYLAIIGFGAVWRVGKTLLAIRKVHPEMSFFKSLFYNVSEDYAVLLETGPLNGPTSYSLHKHELATHSNKYIAHVKGLAAFLNIETHISPSKVTKMKDAYRPKWLEAAERHIEDSKRLYLDDKYIESARAFYYIVRLTMAAVDNNVDNVPKEVRRSLKISIASIARTLAENGKDADCRRFLNMFASESPAIHAFFPERFLRLICTMVATRANELEETRMAEASFKLLSWRNIGSGIVIPYIFGTMLFVGWLALCVLSPPPLDNFVGGMLIIALFAVSIPWTLFFMKNAAIKKAVLAEHPAFDDCQVKLHDVLKDEAVMKRLRESDDIIDRYTWYQLERSRTLGWWAFIPEILTERRFTDLRNDAITRAKAKASSDSAEQPGSRGHTCSSGAEPSHAAAVGPPSHPAVKRPDATADTAAGMTRASPPSHSSLSGPDATADTAAGMTPAGRMAAKPERELDERRAQRNAAEDLQVRLTALIGSYHLMGEEGISGDIRAIAAEVPVDVKVETPDDYRAYSDILKVLKGRRLRNEAQMDKADERNEKDALQRLNLEAIELNAYILKLQLLAAAMILDGGKSPLRSADMRRNAALSALEGALGSAVWLEDELRFRAERLRAAADIKETEADRRIGELVHRVRVGGLDITVTAPSSGEGEPAVTVVEGRWINARTQIKNITRLAGRGNINLAVKKIEELAALYSAGAETPMASYADISRRLQALKEAVASLPDKAAPPAGKMPEISRLAGEAIAAIPETEARKKMNRKINYENRDKVFSGAIKRIARNLVDATVVRRNKAYLESYAVRLMLAGRRGALSQRARGYLTRGLNELAAWAERGIVPPKRFAADYITPALQHIERNELNRAEALLRKAASALGERLDGIKAIIESARRGAVSYKTLRKVRVIFDGGRDMDYVVAPRTTVMDLLAMVNRGPAETLVTIGTLPIRHDAMATHFLREGDIVKLETRLPTPPEVKGEKIVIGIPERFEGSVAKFRAAVLGMMGGTAVVNIYGDAGDFTADMTGSGNCGIFLDEQLLTASIPDAMAALSDQVEHIIESGWLEKAVLGAMLAAIQERLRPMEIDDLFTQRNYERLRSASEGYVPALERLAEKRRLSIIEASRRDTDKPAIRSTTAPQTPVVLASTERIALTDPAMFANIDAMKRCRKDTIHYFLYGNVMDEARAREFVLKSGYKDGDIRFVNMKGKSYNEITREIAGRENIPDHRRIGIRAFEGEMAKDAKEAKGGVVLEVQPVRVDGRASVQCAVYSDRVLLAMLTRRKEQDGMPLSGWINGLGVDNERLVFTYLPDIEAFDAREIDDYHRAMLVILAAA